jgi:hypothetical protein
MSFKIKKLPKHGFNLSSLVPVFRKIDRLLNIVRRSTWKNGRI